METRAGFLLTMEVGRLLGKQECNEASDVELQLLRLITPITKLYTAKQVRTGTCNNMQLAQMVYVCSAVPDVQLVRFKFVIRNPSQSSPILCHPCSSLVCYYFFDVAVPQCTIILKYFHRDLCLN